MSEAIVQEMVVDCAAHTQDYRPLGADALAAYHAQQTAAQHTPQPEQAILAARNRAADLHTLAAAAGEGGAPAWLVALARLLGATA